MSVDLAALETELETNMRYDVDVRRGSNGNLTRLLADMETNKTIYLSVPVNDVKEAIADGIRALNTKDTDTLTYLVGSEGFVDFTLPGIRAEFDDVFKADATTLARVQAIEFRSRTFGEAFVVGPPGGIGNEPKLNDVRTCVKQITKSPYPDITSEEIR